jgi:hypothetical protein
MFNYFKNRKLNLIGFEPCKNVAEEAKKKGYKIINSFFNSKNYLEENNKKAKVITAISMFYDLEDPNTFLKDIKKCLDKNGLFIIQQTYLVSMLEKVIFDNICHEHREYYSVTSLKNVLEKHGFEIFDVEIGEINGGSIRTYIKLKENNNYKTSESVKIILDKEKELKLDTIKPYLKFASEIEECKTKVMDFLNNAKAKGKTVGICGASTKGNTTLQYFGITPDLVVGASDANSDKHGKKTIGTLIPIMSIDEMKKLKPDYQLVLIWHLFEGLKDKEKDFLKEGGKFVLPLPKFKIISDENI